MTEKVQETSTPSAPQNTEQVNFANLRKALEEERREKQELANRIAKLESDKKKPEPKEEEDDSYEPYVDHKRLEKKFNSFESRMKDEITRQAKEEARVMVEKQRQEDWMRNNPDFYDVMQHAQALQDKDPELAESILSMPDGFDRHKLVYKNIKLLGLHKPAPKETIQQKIDNNPKQMYFKQGDIAAPGYSIVGDFSKEGQKAAYEKLLKIKQTAGRRSG